MTVDRVKGGGRIDVDLVEHAQLPNADVQTKTLQTKRCLQGLSVLVPAVGLEPTLHRLKTAWL